VHLPSYPPGIAYASPGAFTDQPGQPGLKTHPSSPAKSPDHKSSGRPPTGAFRSNFVFPKAPPAHPRPDQVRDVALYDNYFSPSVLAIPSGMTVRFTNRGRHHHTTTAPLLWESGELKKGESFSLTFSKTGRYNYFCRLHTGLMRGQIEVFEASPGRGPGAGRELHKEKSP
jgi:plastocyanin